jgi:hypothetical protein
MRRVNVVVCLALAGLAGVMTSGCGRSSAVTAPDEPVVAAAGSSVLHGTVRAPGLGGLSSAAPGVSAQSGGSGWVVSVAGTSLSSELDPEGRFVLTTLPPGSVTVRIEGPGVSAQVAVSGLVNGQVTSVEIQVTGGGAQLTTTPKCTPSAETFFSGSLDEAAGSKLVVAGRSVDAGQVRVVWRGERRVQLSDLQVGELVKVWGELRGDGIVVAEEIQALTSGALKWVSFSGKVEYVSAGFLPTPGPSYYPTLVVKGTKVHTKPETKVRRSDGSDMLACDIKVGQSAAVEGWKKPDGSVTAAKIVIQ